MKLGSLKEEVVRMGSALVGLASRLAEYCTCSTVHGLQYITEKGRHFTERLFWILTCGLSGYLAYLLLRATWYNFENNSVSFGVDTAYLDWDTSFPAVSICENESPDKIFEAGSKLFGDNRNMNMDFFLRDIAFFDGTCYSCKSHCGVQMNCSQDFTSIVKQIRADCQKLMGNCSWNGESFECCSHFLPLETETGLCYTLNSIHTKKNKTSLKFISNRKTGPGRLSFQVFEAVRLFMHGMDDVPYINHPQEEKAVLNWGSLFSLLFHVNEIDNDPTLDQVEVHQRNCRFPQENVLKAYGSYSYSACIVDCRAKSQLALCNCTHHFMPKRLNAKTCDIKGLACLTKYSEMLRAVKTRENIKKGLVCDCMSSCTEPEYKVISKTQDTNDDYTQPYGTKVTVMMATLPSIRFKRNVVRTRLDLVVSMGGTAGLFLGASLLSTAEIVYFLLVRRRRKAEESGGAASGGPSPGGKREGPGRPLVTRLPPRLKRAAHLKHRDGYVFPYLT